MKIRTDFVTNSSSSSFTVYLNLSCEDGTRISLTGYDDSGDYDAQGCRIEATGADGQELYSESVDPVEFMMDELETFDIDEIGEMPWEIREDFGFSPGDVNMARIVGTRSAEELKSTVTKAFGMDSGNAADCDFSDEDEEYSEAPSETAMALMERLTEKYNSMRENCARLFDEHIGSREAVKNISMEMEFTGRGECLADSGEILERIFGWKQKSQITQVLANCSAGDAVAALRGLPFLSIYTDASLYNIAEFVEKCEYPPNECNVSQHLLDDGRVEMSFDWDGNCSSGGDSAAAFGFDAYDAEKLSEPFVFISYKREDYEAVGTYARYLHDNGINVWYDNGLRAGSDWESYLMTVIEKPNCAAVLLFVTEKIGESTIIPLETTQARACKKPAVAIYLEPGLDLEVLLSKAIKVYLGQRQSVNAYLGSRESVCAEILEAAKNAMTNAPSAVGTQAEELWQKANVFLLNARRSRSENDTGKAKEFLTKMTEEAPDDYRGWLGLALCECLRRPEDSAAALRQLNDCSKYYSYVVALGADGKASHEYTAAKSNLWYDTLDMLRAESQSADTCEKLCNFLNSSALFKECFGHTTPDIKPAFDGIFTAAADRLTVLTEAELQAATQEDKEVIAQDTGAPAETPAEEIISGETAAAEISEDTAEEAAEETDETETGDISAESAVETAETAAAGLPVTDVPAAEPESARKSRRSKAGWLVPVIIIALMLLAAGAVQYLGIFDIIGWILSLLG